MYSLNSNPKYFKFKQKYYIPWYEAYLLEQTRFFRVSVMQFKSKQWSFMVKKKYFESNIKKFQAKK